MRTTFYNKKHGVWMEGPAAELLQTESQDIEAAKVHVIEGEAWRTNYNSGKTPFSIDGTERTTFYAQTKDGPTDTFNANGEPEKVQTIEGEAWRAAYNSGQPPFSATGNPRTTFYGQKK